MASVLHALHGAETVLRTLGTIWAAAGELLTAGAILWALNAVANLIRGTYRAGQVVGAAYFRWLHPAILAAADGISWLVASIDWQEVRATVRHGLITLIALVITAWQCAIPLLVRCSEAIGRRYAAWLLGTAQPTIRRQAAPHIQPLHQLADDLHALSRHQLQAITGCRRKLPKAQLVALALAC